MAETVPQFDLDGLTTDEMVMLADALKCTTAEQVQTRLASIKPGHTPIDVMKPLLWLAQRQVDPTFTFEQAGQMPLVRLMALVEAGSKPSTPPKTKNTRKAR